MTIGKRAPIIQKRADLINEERAMLDKAAAEDRPLSEKEKTRCDAIDTELTVVNVKLEELGGMPSSAWVDPGFGPDLPGVGKGKGKSYRDMFGQPRASDWESGEQFWATLHSGRADPRLLPAASPGIVALQREGEPALGGFSVPEELVAGMLDASLESELVRPRAQVHPMKSATLKIWGFDSSTSAGGCLFGMSPQWMAETGTIAADEASVRMITLDAKKLALLPSASNELIADGVSFEEQLETAMIKALGWGMDYGFLRGTGAGQPSGVLGASCLITVAKLTGQLAGTIDYRNLVMMFARLHPACVSNSVWVASPTTIPQLSTLSLTVGVGGAPIPVMTSDSGQFIILTRPVLFSEKMSALGAVGDILLADFSQYAVGLRKEVSIDKSQHLGFQQDISTYRGIVRVDGQPLWADPYTPVNGDSLSCFVTLAART